MGCEGLIPDNNEGSGARVKYLMIMRDVRVKYLMIMRGGV